MLAIYLEDEQINYIPEKDSGYTLDLTKSSCNNGVTIAWDSDSWNALVNFANYSAENINRTKCTMYFIEADFCDLNPDAAVCIILALTNDSSELVYDETDDNNLRYIGANPENYVWFNNELWRIIGVMNNVDDGTGKKESRLKLVRNASYGFIAWGGQKNDWSLSFLQQELNTTYLNNIDITAQNMLSDAIWKLGGSNTSDDVTTSMFYERERGSNVYSGSSVEWTGKVALMYPSDYGYATSGGSNTDRATCLSSALSSWNSYSDCYTNDWLFDSKNPQWTLTTHSSVNYGIFRIYSSGVVNYTTSISVGDAVAVPTVYLKSFVKITGGTGTSTDPYQLSL